MSDTDRQTNGYANLSPFDKWIKATKELGIPVVLASVLLFSHFTVMRDIVRWLERNTYCLERVEKKLGIDWTAHRNGEGR